MAGWQQFLRPPIANLKTKILDLLSDFPTMENCHANGEFLAQITKTVP